MIVAKSQYPNVFRALGMLYLDNGAMLKTTVINVPDTFTSSLPSIEASLRKLSPSQMNTLVSGEETDQKALVQHMQLQKVLDFLNYLFDNYM